MTEKKLSLQEAFYILVQKRAWYKDSLEKLYRNSVSVKINVRIAQRDKLEFLKAKDNNYTNGLGLAEDRIRFYLINAGAKCSQEEKWFY